MAGEWYCQILGEVLGPVSREHLGAMARSHSLVPIDLVREGDGPWVRAESVSGLFPESSDHAPADDSSTAGDATDVGPLAPMERVKASVDDSSGDAADENGPTRTMESAGPEEDVSPAPPTPPTSVRKEHVLGNYIVLEKIGKGGMGMVLKAQHRRMKRLVALKLLPPAVNRSERAVKRFQREVEAAARLVHPNIVTAYDADEAEGLHFLVMEFVDGIDLGALLEQGGPLPVKTALYYIIQAAKGLEYAHAEGVVHRDIKPANLLVDKKGNVKILDMGIARFDDAEADDVDGDDAPHEPTAHGLTMAGQMMGTVDYMPPEQTLDARTADQRSDIYSLGCTMYRLLTGHAVYPGESDVLRMQAHREAPIPSLLLARRDIPGYLDYVFRRMVAKRPEDRYPSMHDVIRELEACAGPAGAGAGFSPLEQSHLRSLSSAAAVLPATSRTPAVSAPADEGDLDLAPLEDESPAGSRVHSRPSQVDTTPEAAAASHTIGPVAAGQAGGGHGPAAEAHSREPRPGHPPGRPPVPADSRGGVFDVDLEGAWNANKSALTSGTNLLQGSDEIGEPPVDPKVVRTLIFIACVAVGLVFLAILLNLLGWLD